MADSESILGKKPHQEYDQTLQSVSKEAEGSASFDIFRARLEKSMSSQRKAKEFKFLKVLPTYIILWL